MNINLDFFLNARRKYLQSLRLGVSVSPGFTGENWERDALDEAGKMYKEAVEIYNIVADDLSWSDCVTQDLVNWERVGLKKFRQNATMRMRDAVTPFSAGQYDTISYKQMVLIELYMHDLLKNKLYKEASEDVFDRTERDLAVMLLNTVKPSNPTVKKILNKIAGWRQTRRFVRHLGRAARATARKKAPESRAKARAWFSRKAPEFRERLQGKQKPVFGGGSNRRTKKRKSRCRMTKRRMTKRRMTKRRIAKRRMTKRKKSKKKRTKHKRTKRR